MIDGPEWHETRTWTKDRHGFGFVPERARHEIVKLLDLLDCYSDALMDMVNQHCQIDDELVADSGLSANECAFSLLASNGLLEETNGPGRYRLLWENLQHDDT